MKRFYPRNTFLIFVSVLFFFSCFAALPKTAQAAACTASVSGNWSASATWGGSCNSGSYPGATAAGDTVTINSGVTVTLDISPAHTIGSITVSAAGAANGITWSGTNSLEVTGATSIAAATAAVSSTLAVGAGTFKADGSVTITGSGTSGRNSILNVSTGIITFGSGLTFGGTAGEAQFTTTSVATINLTGTIGTQGTLSIAAGTNLIAVGTGAITYATAVTTWGTLTINSGVTLTLSGAAETFTGITIANTGTLSTTKTITDSGAGANALVCGNGGTATISGTAGAITMTGASAQISSTGVCTASITGTFTISGATAPQITSGSTYSFVSLTISGPTTNNGTTTVTTTLAGASTLTNSGTGTLNITAGSVTPTLTATASGNTVNYNGGAQTCAAKQYYNLTLSGSGTKTCATTGVSGNLVYSGTGAWALSSAFTVSGTLTVSGTGGGITTAGFAFTVNGTTSISAGTLTLNNSTGAKTLTGMITLSGGTLAGSATSTIFGAGITNNGTGAVTITGSSTFPNAGETLSGANLITLGYVAVTGAVTNNATTTVSGVLSGAGSWTQGASSTLTLSLGGAPVSISSFDAHTNVNDVFYSGAAQTCFTTQYYDLNFSGSGVVTCAPTSPILRDLAYITTGASTWALTAPLTVNRNMTVSSTVAATVTLGGTTTVNGNLIISALDTLDTKAASSYALNLNGNYTNNGAFTARAGTVTLGGTNQQSLSGTMTGSSAFYNLTITNNTGTHPSDCELTGFTPSVVFLTGASSTNNFAITTGGVNVQYGNGLSYSFLNTNWVGPSGNPIYFRNSAAGSGTWLLKVAGTQVPLTYINVSRSDATTLGGSTINAANITNHDCANNTNWLFGASSTSPSAYSQVAYQWYQNQNSAQVGPKLAAVNSTTTLATVGQAFRLRMLLAVDATNSIASTDSFLLQFANKGNGASCSSTQFGYANVTAVSAIAYNTNSLVTNGVAMTPTSTDPTDGGRTTVEQTYQSGGIFTVTSTIPSGEDGNWDFSLIDNSPGNTDYCFQVIFSSTTPLYAYNIYPEIITAPSPLPVISVPVFNNGLTNIILTPNATTSITVVASTTDPGGPGNILYATSTIYRSSLGSNCTANNLNCYQIPSSNCVFSGSSSTVTCTAGLWYFAQSTGVPSSSFPSDSWTAAITVKDGGGYSQTANSSPANVNVLTAINVTTSSINYSTILPNTNTGSTNQIVTVQNVGNSSTTLQLSGTSFVSGGYNIATSSQHYATSGFTFGGAEQQLSDTLTTVSGFVLTGPTSTSSVQGSIYWGDAVPPGSPKGTYTATTTFASAFSQ